MNDQICFNILVPAGVRYEKAYDLEYYTEGPPNNSMFALTLFLIQVLPNTVNFGNVWFEEDIEEQSIPWPDGTDLVCQEREIATPVADVDGTPNWFGDLVGTGGPWYVDHLFNPNTLTYESCQFDVVQNLLFYAEDQWNLFFINWAQTRLFMAGSLEACVAWDGVFGGFLGPYTHAGY